MIIKIASQLLFIFFFGFTITYPILSQEPQSLNTVIINGEVRLTRESGVFRYTYTVTNPSTNTGQVGLIDIDISKPVGGLELSDEGLVNGPGYLEQSSKAILEQSVPGIPIVPMIPVGVQSPPNWIGGLSVLGTVGWGNAGESFRMLPGQSVSGYQITSRGLPGIRTFTAEPHLEYDHLPIVPPNETDEDLERYKKDLAALKASESAKGKTIGPTAPPANFVALDFLSYLVDLKHQSQTLGWIGGPKFIAELDKKLDQVKEKLLANNIPSARGKLKSFINKVEAQFKETKEHEVEKVKAPEKWKKGEEKKFITAEGYGLLKFNAMYLRDQLGPGEKSEEDKDAEKDD
ncbi:MAG TPA: hypothetical protein VJM77_05295 [Nitrospiria bacterium]|nr:hypothetical protein [Nitrospiria bacterium]